MCIRDRYHCAGCEYAADDALYHLLLFYGWFCLCGRGDVYKRQHLTNDTIAQNHRRIAILKGKRKGEINEISHLLNLSLIHISCAIVCPDGCITVYRKKED